MTYERPDPIDYDDEIDEIGGRCVFCQHPVGSWAANKFRNAVGQTVSAHDGCLDDHAYALYEAERDTA